MRTACCKYQWNGMIDEYVPNAIKWGTLRERSNLRYFLSHCRYNKEHFDTKIKHVACFDLKLRKFQVLKMWKNVNRMFWVRPIEKANQKYNSDL